MDIEELSKQQMVLLAALVSFITSIATGIVTVSMLEETPVSVTRTVNRVVERTVEKVSSGNSAVKGVTKEKTVVLQGEEQIMAAIKEGSDAIVRIYQEGAASTSTFSGIGVPVTKNIVVSDNFSEAGETQYYGELDGKAVKLNRITSENSFSFFSISDDEDARFSKQVTFTNVDEVQLGQTAITVTGENRNIASTGIVSEIIHEESTSTPSVSEVRVSIPNEALTAGAPVLNRFGEVMGIITVDADGGIQVVTVNQIHNSLQRKSAE